MQNQIARKDSELNALAQFMRIAIGAGTIVAGADKFTHLICDWDKYLSPRAERMVPVRGSTFMKLVGIVEIAVGAGILVRKTSSISSYAAAGWLACIAGNLLTHPVNYKDIAIRDLHMAIEAFALGKLAQHYLADAASSSASGSIDEAESHSLTHMDVNLAS